MSRVQILDGGCITSGLLRYRFAIMVWSKHIDITNSYISALRIYHYMISPAL